MSSEKRKSQRFEFEEPVQVYPVSQPSSDKESSQPTQVLSLKGKNISKDGMCLLIDNFFMPDQILKLDFQFAKSKPIQTFAIVMWSERKTCGLRFIKPDGELKGILEKWVSPETEKA